MTCQIYWASGSPFSWSTLLALEIKGIDYVSKRQNVTRSAFKTPAFLAMNPRGQLPVLQDGDTIVRESVAILAYLERKHPEPPLFGTSPEETGQIWQVIFELEHYLRKPMMGIVRPIFTGQAAECSDEIVASTPDVHKELETYEQRISDGPWLVGQSLSAADIIFYPWVKCLLRAAEKDVSIPLELGLLPFEQRYPHLHAWMARFEALPSYDTTYPPHWRDR